MQRMIDNVFFWTTSLEDNVYNLRGKQFNMIIFNNSQWSIIDAKSGNKLLTLDDSVPFGAKSWIDHATNMSITLSLDSCGDGYFNCADGWCIEDKKRCDGVLDCYLTDTDEESCSLLAPTLFYDNALPPLNLDSANSSTYHLDLDIVYFSCLIYMIDDEDSTLHLQFGIFLKWRDPRMSYANLRDGENNTLAQADISKLWTPEVSVYYTTLDGFTEDLGSKDIILYPTVPGGHTGTKTIKKTTVHGGRDVEITKRSWYNAIIICQMKQVQNFPFDRDDCTVRLISHMSSTWENIKEDSPVRFNVTHWNPIIKQSDLGLYEIENVTIDTEQASGSAIITIKTRRNFLSIYFQYAFPTILMSELVYMSILFYKERYDIAMSTNITCLLAMSGFFTSLFNSLPTSSKIKLIDMLHLKGIILCSLVTLLETYIVLEEEAVEDVSPKAGGEAWAAQKTEEKKRRRVFSNAILCTLPFISLTIDAIFFTAGMLYMAGII